MILVTSFPKCPPGNFSSLSRPLTPVFYLPEVRLRAIVSFDHLSFGPPDTPMGRDCPAPFVVQLSGRVLPCPSREELPWEREEGHGQPPDNGARSLAELGASMEGGEEISGNFLLCLLFFPGNDRAQEIKKSSKNSLCHLTRGKGNEGEGSGAMQLQRGTQ